MAQFSEAQKLYNANKFSEALIAYDRIIKKYPGHEPSIIQYAKTLYRLDRIPESYNLFARINPQYLDAETSYEYGYASYTNARWDAALYSFKRVPNEHALFDLANYYGALAAIKLKRYAEADDMLEKAVVLPDKLAKSRTLYQKHVQSLRHLQEKADLDEAAAVEKSRLNQKPASPQDGVTLHKDTKPESYQHSGFLGVERVAKVTVAKNHQIIDKHGYSTTTFDNEIGEFKFSHGPVVPFSPFSSMPDDESSAAGLQLNLSVSDRNTKGRQERIVVYEDSRDIPRVLGDDIPAEHFTVGSIGAAGWVELALGNSVWTGIEASLSFDYPKFERGQRTGLRSLSPHLGRKFKFGDHSGIVLASAVYEQLTDSETEPLVDTAKVNLETEVIFESDTTLNLTLSANQFKYHLPTMAGPDDTYTGTGKVKQSFPLGISISASGTAGATSNHIVRGLETFGDASADGTLLSGTGTLQATPVSWLSLSANYQIAKTTWTVHQEDRIDAFKKNVPDFVEQTTLKGSLIFNF